MASVEAVIDGQDGRQLILRDMSGTDEDARYTAVLSMDAGCASTTVWEYHSGLAAFVRELATAWRGFDGVKEYSTIEGQLHLSCRHDGRGTIACRATLRQPWTPEWTMEVAMELGAGAHLDRVAADVEAFFKQLG